MRSLPCCGFPRTSIRLRCAVASRRIVQHVHDPRPAGVADALAETAPERLREGISQRRRARRERESRFSTGPACLRDFIPPSQRPPAGLTLAKTQSTPRKKSVLGVLFAAWRDVLSRRFRKRRARSSSGGAERAQGIMNFPPLRALRLCEISLHGNIGAAGRAPWLAQWKSRERTCSRPRAAVSS